MKITFGKSEPYLSGWKGWADWIDVFVDGEQIGMLFAEKCYRRRQMEYTFKNGNNHPEGSPFHKSNPAYADIQVSELGIKAAKQKLIAALKAKHSGVT